MVCVGKGEIAAAGADVYDDQFFFILGFFLELRDRGAAEDLRLLARDERIRTRKPLAYLLGEAWLSGLRFAVDERVIVPRSFISELLPDELSPWTGRPANVGVIGVAIFRERQPQPVAPPAVAPPVYAPPTSGQFSGHAAQRAADAEFTWLGNTRQPLCSGNMSTRAWASASYPCADSLARSRPRVAGSQET